MARTKGSKNRNYPPVPLAEAMRVPEAIQDQASGMSVSRLTLSDLLGVSPSSSQFRELVAAARQYGLTTGGINSDEFGLTDLGQAATGGNEDARSGALKAAVMNIPPFRTFLQTLKNKKVPGEVALRDFLSKSAGVASNRAQECAEFILADAETAGLTRTLQGSRYVQLDGVPAPRASASDAPDGEATNYSDDIDNAGMDGDTGSGEATLDKLDWAGADGRPKKVFIAHGSNRTPLDQLKKALDQFKVEYVVAVDEPHRGRPVSEKVARLMREECSSGIFIFTADEHFKKEGDGGGMVDVWRPRENVVYELGAASILYENRIVIFKEKGVTFPSDFSDLGYIEFEKDQLVAELGALFTELVSLDILEVRAKG